MERPGTASLGEAAQGPVLLGRRGLAVSGLDWQGEARLSKAGMPRHRRVVLELVRVGR